MIKKRKQELKHAQDIKELYEKKLERVNDLFVELNAWKLQLEEEQRTLAKKERQLNIKGSKVHYKKKFKPILGAVGRSSAASYRISATGLPTQRVSSPTTPEVLSTSPEVPFQAIGLPLGTSTPIKSKPAQIVVRENPMFAERLKDLHNIYDDAPVAVQCERHPYNLVQLVRPLGFSFLHP